MSDVSFQSHAVLVHLKIGRWAARKSDKTVSDQVADSHGAVRGVGKYYKTLLKSDALKKFDQICDRARAADYKMTFDWSGPQHLLPAKLLDKYMDEMREYRLQAEAAVEEFMGEYDDCRRKARTFLGKLFKEKDYPPAEVVRSKFYFRYTVFPVPSASDFRVELMGKQRKEIEKEFTDHFKDVQREMLEDLWGRVHALVEKAYKKLSDKDAIFRDSLIINMREFVDLLPALNIMNDKRINQVAAEIKSKLSQHKPDDLRLDHDLRERVANDADKILRKMAGFVGPASKKAA